MNGSGPVPRTRLCLILFFIVNTGRTVSADDGFLGLSFGGRALAMGGAYTAVADGPDAGLWNPAGLARLDRPTLSGSQNHLTFTENTFALTLNQPAGRWGTLSVSALELNVANTALTRPVLDANGNPVLDPSTGQPLLEVTGYGDETDGEFLLGYGLRTADWLDAGATVKLLVGRAGRIMGNGVGADGGIILVPGRGVRVGLLAEDLGRTTFRWGDGLRTLMEPRGRAGVAWQALEAMMVSVDVRSPFGRFKAVLAAGGEYRIAESLVLRAGMDDFRATGGVGFRMPLGTEGGYASADYAFVTGGSYEDHNRLTLTVAF